MWVRHIGITAWPPPQQRHHNHHRILCCGRCTLQPLRFLSFAYYVVESVFVVFLPGIESDGHLLVGHVWTCRRGGTQINGAVFATELFGRCKHSLNGLGGEGCFFCFSSTAGRSRDSGLATFFYIVSQLTQATKRALVFFT